MFCCFTQGAFYYLAFSMLIICQHCSLTILSGNHISSDWDFLIGSLKNNFIPWCWRYYVCVSYLSRVEPIYTIRSCISNTLFSVWYCSITLCKSIKTFSWSQRNSEIPISQSKTSSQAWWIPSNHATWESV